jgi:hypothetical protein
MVNKVNNSSVQNFLSLYKTTSRVLCLKSNVYNQDLQIGWVIGNVVGVWNISFYSYISLAYMPYRDPSIEKL